jgi:hypothetical protein
MNWMERARREIRESSRQPTAVTAERDPTAVLAVPHPARREKLWLTNGSNDSTPTAGMLESETLREDFQERAAILEFDGGLSRDEAERSAWVLVSKRYRSH